jgi:UTP--glucose-1-phosphate uridylyltransferase
LERAFEEAGKFEMAASIRDTLPPHVHAVYVRQRAPLGLRHAVLYSRPAVGDAPFAVLLADEFIVADAGAPNPTADLAQAISANDRSQLLLQEVMPSHTQKYGIAVPGAGHDEIAGLIEKPSPGDAPSQLASIGRYVLHPEVFDVLSTLGPGRCGEIQLADAIDALARRGRVGARALRGKRHDCGSHPGYLGAVIAAASRHPEFGVEFRDIMAAELSSNCRGA